MALMIRMAGVTSNFGKTLKTIDMPKLWAVLTTNTKRSVRSDGHSLLPNRALKILSKNVNKYGTHIVTFSIQTHLSFLCSIKINNIKKYWKIGNILG